MSDFQATWQLIGRFANFRNSILENFLKHDLNKWSISTRETGNSNWLILQVWTNSVSNTLIVSLIKIFRFFLIINIFKRKNELVKSLNYFERKANLMFRKWITSAERARGQVGELGVHGVCVIASLHLPAHFVHFQNRMNVALREDIAWKMILLKIKKKNREPSSSESLSSSSKSLIHSRFGKFRFFRLNSLERWKLENSWKWFFFKKSNFFRNGNHIPKYPSVEKFREKIISKKNTNRLLPQIVIVIWENRPNRENG